MMKIDWIGILKKAAFWNRSSTLPMACKRDAGSSVCLCEQRSACQADAFDGGNACFRDDPCKYHRRAKCTEHGPTTAKDGHESRWEGGDEW
ncbi:MAG: hypothetical protein IKW38_00300 [Kiritimatiellae bacterium]|nr:hypothetical protein [Kiritimatiellia bacterium]